MKKVLSFLFLAAFALVLTGCGKGNVLTCTADDEKYEITFKDDKVTKAVATYTANSSDEATLAAALMEAAYGTNNDVKIKTSGKKVIVTITGAALEDEEMTGTKAEIKSQLEEAGYKCK